MASSVPFPVRDVFEAEPQKGLVQDVMGCHRTLAVRLVCLGAIGCASSVVLIMEMRCSWSLSATAWQICVSSSQTFSRAPDYAAGHVAARHVAGCQILRCRREEDAGN